MNTWKIQSSREIIKSMIDFDNFVEGVKPLLGDILKDEELTISGVRMSIIIEGDKY